MGLVRRGGDQIKPCVAREGDSLAAAPDVDDVLVLDGILLIVRHDCSGAREADHAELAAVTDLFGANFRRRGHVEPAPGRDGPTKQDAVAVGEHEPDLAGDEESLDEEPLAQLVRCEVDELVTVRGHPHVRAHV